MMSSKLNIITQKKDLEIMRASSTKMSVLCSVADKKKSKSNASNC